MKVYLYILIAVCLLPSCEKTITEFQAQNFIKFFGSGIESEGNNVIVADPEESSYLFVGNDNVGGNVKTLAVKTDKFGNIVWENIYEDSAQEVCTGTLVKKTGDDFIIIGSTRVISPENPKLIKIDRYGDVIWKTNLTRNFKLIINDFIIVDTLIFVAGESYKYSPTVPQCYYACLNTAGVFKWEHQFPGAEKFKKIFLNKNGKLILVGNSSIPPSRLIIISEANITGGFPEIKTEDYPVNVQIIKDAVYKNDDGSLYLLIYDQTTNISKVIKYASNYNVEWTTINSDQGYSGESLTLKDDGTIFVACDFLDKITFLKVDSNGELYSGNADFKNLPGDAGGIQSTPDNGLIIVGSTTSTFGTMVQLIKTDKDLYLLKP